MHLVAETETWDPYPPVRQFDDTVDRRHGNRALLISAAGLAVTGAAELATAVLSGSAGLLGDALHNLSDVSTSAVVFIGFRLSRRTATPRFPYGYERAEDLAGLGVAAAVWASAGFAAAVSLHKLTDHGRTTNLGLGMAAAVIGILGNQLVARYKRRVGTRIQSAALLADAQHSWLDAIASAGAFLGLVGVAAGYRWADGIAGLIVTGFIVHVGWEVTAQLVAHLMDGVDPDVLERAVTAALGIDGVSHAHVRARWLGRSLVIEVEGFVAPERSLGEAEALAQPVQEAVTAAVPESRAVIWLARGLPTAP